MIQASPCSSHLRTEKGHVPLFYYRILNFSIFWGWVYVKTLVVLPNDKQWKLTSVWITQVLSGARAFGSGLSTTAIGTTRALRPVAMVLPWRLRQCVVSTQGAKTEL
jgi:hypothetical protein